VNTPANRRDFLKTAALAGAAISLPKALPFPSSKKLLVFTKSSGFEHQVVKRTDGKLSICENAVTELGKKHGFAVECSKDGRIFDSAELSSFQAALFLPPAILPKSAPTKSGDASRRQTEITGAIHGGMGFPVSTLPATLFILSPILRIFQPLRRLR
jgi:hypothetical protein